jgi:hypothetical protein
MDMDTRGMETGAGAHGTLDIELVLCTANVSHTHMTNTKQLTLTPGPNRPGSSCHRAPPSKWTEAGARCCRSGSSWAPPLWSSCGSTTSATPGPPSALCECGSGAARVRSLHGPCLCSKPKKKRGKKTRGNTSNGVRGAEVLVGYGGGGCGPCCWPAQQNQLTTTLEPHQGTGYQLAWTAPLLNRGRPSVLWGDS